MSEHPHPSRVTVTGPSMVTGLLPACRVCPLPEGHDEPHLHHPSPLGLDGDNLVALPRDAHRDDWPPHRPECYDAPIPGRQWFAGCEPGGDFDPETGRYAGTGPRVDPATGRCESCGETACRECGRENCPDHPEGGTR